jgi:hypothetical protein
MEHGTQHIDVVMYTVLQHVVFGMFLASVWAKLQCWLTSDHRPSTNTALWHNKPKEHQSTYKYVSINELRE